MDTNYYIKLLKANHNIVLTGAPGTGKTYLANEIVKTMHAEHVFVQFHPSYDYTDFVEGLRPVTTGNNTVGFERKDGIFKEFCTKALRNYVDSKKTEKQLTADKTLTERYNSWIGRINNGEDTTLQLKAGKATMEAVRVSNNNNIIFRFTQSDSDREYTLSLSRLQKLANAYKTLDELNAIQNIYKACQSVIGGCTSSLYWAALRYLYTQPEGIEQATEQPSHDYTVSTVQQKDYVFIIDEINRGEISKIFGELFFAIDPGYRGEKGKVRTQYANLCDEPNDFDDYLANHEGG